MEFLEELLRRGRTMIDRHGREKVIILLGRDQVAIPNRRESKRAVAGEVMIQSTNDKLSFYDLRQGISVIYDESDPFQNPLDPEWSVTVTLRTFVLPTLRQFMVLDDLADA